MRILCSLFILLATLFQGYATELLDQLSAFNPYWCHHQEVLEGLPSKPIANDQDYVQAHLHEVVQVLEQTATTHLDAGQREMRHELIAELDAYAQQGCFPVNYYRSERIPVFIDEHNTHCAVGHLMQYTGNEQMAQRIAAANNYAWVREIQDSELQTWQDASGFSLAELKLIQGAYDFYIHDAFLLPNKYEVPQKPEQIVRCFEGADKEKVWCYGEGENGDLHGKWIQNYSSTMPWIVGYFEHGKRSGRWKEYYKGTNKLCRTEHWRDDELNGIRTRYDREGKVIETILFKNGEAITKTNIDYEKALRWVREPLDSVLVSTEVFTEEGALIAAGKERIHNPEGLSWFQNIELTALNTFAISARDGAPRPEEGIMVSGFDLNAEHNQLPGQRTLVEYRKEGSWVYYKDYLNCELSADSILNREGQFTYGYAHFGSALYTSVSLYKDLQLTASYDSIQVVYLDDQLMDLFGFQSNEQDHLRLSYHVPLLPLIQSYRHFQFDPASVRQQVKSISSLNEAGELIDVRVHFDRQEKLLRKEHFLVPYREDGEVLGVR